MRLAYSSNAYTRCGIVEAIHHVADLGYDGIELMADQPHLWPANVKAKDIEAARAALDQRRLAISNINAFMMTAAGDFWHPSWIEPDREDRRRRVRHTTDALTLAGELGAPSISTEPGGPLPADMPRSTALDMFVDGLGETLETAERCGVRLLVEPEPGLLIERSAEYLDLAERIASPMLGLNFDIGHFFCAREDLAPTITRLAPWTRHYHVEDIAASRVHHHLIPGQGAIDFENVFRAIRATQYAGWITVELYTCHEDPDGAGREARARLQPLLLP